MTNILIDLIKQIMYLLIAVIFSKHQRLRAPND